MATKHVRIKDDKYTELQKRQKRTKVPIVQQVDVLLEKEFKKK
jgi:hypothetical protein